MASRYSYKWPMEAWAVCYYSNDCPGGRIPFSGEIYWYKDEAEKKAKERPHSAVRRVYVDIKATR